MLLALDLVHRCRSSFPISPCLHRSAAAGTGVWSNLAVWVCNQDDTSNQGTRRRRSRTSSSLSPFFASITKVGMARMPKLCANASHLSASTFTNRHLPAYLHALQCSGTQETTTKRVYSCCERPESRLQAILKTACSTKDWHSVSVPHDMHLATGRPTYQRSHQKLASSFDMVHTKMPKSPRRPASGRRTVGNSFHCTALSPQTLEQEGVINATYTAIRPASFLYDSIQVFLG